jgi:hypothetical protein
MKKFLGLLAKYWWAFFLPAIVVVLWRVFGPDVLFIPEVDSFAI